MLVRNSQAFSYKELLQHRKYSEKNKKSQEIEKCLRETHKHFFSRILPFSFRQTYYFRFSKRTFVGLEV